MSTLLEPIRPFSVDESPSDKEIAVVPYNGNFDPNAKFFLPWFWERLREDDLLRLYFPDSIETSFPQFVSMFSGGSNIVLVVVKENGEIKDTVGFASWEPMLIGRAKMAHCGFIFLKEYWDHHTSDEAARKIMQYWFEEAEVKPEVLVGMIAKDNILANRFMRRIGWIESGNLPLLHLYQGKQTDAIIWTLTTEQWKEHKCL